MRQNNILNNMNKDTELSPVTTYSNVDNKKIKDEENKNKLNDINNALKFFKIDFKSIDIKENLTVYLVLAFLIIISLICGIINKKFDIFIGIIVLIYATILLLSKEIVLPNTRYTHISTWNLYNSLNMIIKSLFPDLIDELNYSQFISFSSILCMVSIFLGFVPYLSFILIISLMLLIASYLYSFCNKDVDLIKESLKYINTVSPFVIVSSTIVGCFIYKIYGININGYILWIILKLIESFIREYKFEEI